MKKLGICLLALAMVLGFVSCNKDAETGGNAWVEKTIYIHDGAFYLSEAEAKEAGYDYDKNEDDDYYNVFVYNHPGFTAVEVCEYYRIDKDGKFEDEPYLNESGFTLATTVNEFFDDEYCGIINDMAIIMWDPYTLNKNGATEKKLIYFDDGSTLTIYYHEPEVSPK